jgi:hypothetical protein
LDDRLQQLQATVTALVERSAGTAVAPSAADSEVVAASRTLKMAEQTAEATVSEARDEAAKLLAGAREQHDATLAAAQQSAEAEFAAQRETVVSEQAVWDARKRELTDEFVKIEAQLAECDARLAEAHRLVRTLLEEPALAGTTESPAAVLSPSSPVGDHAAVAPEATAPAQTEPPLFTSPRVDAPVPAAEAPPETVEDDPATKETVFGNPPAPVFTGPAKEAESGAQAFYPWSGNSAPGGAEGDPAEQTDSASPAAEAPAPPVQRRGLFGH